MQRAVALQPFDGDDARAVELDQREDARVDGEEVAVAAADEDRARAAVALLADDLRAGGGGVVAEVIRQRRERRRAGHAMLAAVDEETNGVAHIAGSEQRAASRWFSCPLLAVR